MIDDEERKRLSSCVSKARHATFGAARLQLAKGKTSNSGGRKGLKMGVYHCKFCGGYHIGHKPVGKR